MKELVLGGVRSGKSRFAERIAKESGLSVTYIATAEAHDGEMEKRIADHQSRRPAHWNLIEEPIYLSETLLKNCADDRLILVECLTLWITNLLMANDENLIDSEINRLIETTPKLTGHIIYVGNETGLGVIPTGELARKYCDLAGRTHQRLAEICDRLYFLVAGVPQLLKGKSE